MDADWITSPTARRILVHWADARPAWLWSDDGRTLVWRNAAARLFGAKHKKHGIRLAGDAVPIKGRVARLVRLGSPNRTSLARLHFLIDGKPVSETCACTPLRLEDGQAGLLAVGVEPIEAQLLAGAETSDPMSRTLLPGQSRFLVLGPDGVVLGGSIEAVAAYPHGIDAADGQEVAAEPGASGQRLRVNRYRASPQGAELVLFRPLTAGGPGHEVGNVPAITDGTPGPETPARVIVGRPGEPTARAPEPPPPPVAPLPDIRSLTSLFDRLAGDTSLYAPLGAGDDVLLTPPPPRQPPKEPPIPEASPQGRLGQRLFRIVGRRFTPVTSPPSEETTLEPKPAATPPPGAAPEGELASVPPPPDMTIVTPTDAETVERVSRYNFDELSRILTDRVNGDFRSDRAEQDTARKRGRDNGEAALVNMTGETFVLNRLPLGILVFRDQQVIFANRAFLELAGHETIESLRQAGLAALFPSETGGFDEAGPVTQLVRRDGVQVPVSAKLQSIAWQGRPALLLTANSAERRIGHESAVRTFAEILAEAREEGFVAADAIGVVSAISAYGRTALGLPEADIVGRPLSVLIERSEIDALKAFLARPARFAETARPSILLHGPGGGTELVLFAEGQAGIVTGYFGLVRRRRQVVVSAPTGQDTEPALLGRVSRGIRRPLNTIVGFSDIIASAAFGPIDNPRYLEYAHDIRTAGHEIAALVDELDDYARLRDGRYATRPTDIDLAALLESCVVRVRAQAKASRVLVRSAISQQLPRIRADRASLGQAVLNLMASAIDQTPAGGTVVLSARTEDDGGIAVHVRDSSGQRGDLNERFVVFRDGVDRDGTMLSPVRSSVGLQLTRSLLQVNACSLSVDPAGENGMIFTLIVPEDLLVRQ